MGCHFAACSVAVRVAALFPGFWDDFADGVSFAVVRCVFPDLRSGRMKKTNIGIVCWVGSLMGPNIERKENCISYQLIN